MKKLFSLALIATLLLALIACGAPAAIPNPPLVLGEKYLTDLDYEQALLQFDQAIVIEPKNPRGYLGKADALLHLDRQADAASALGDGAKQCRAQRAALNEAKAAVAKSLVDGYIGLSTAYEKLGWREIALALLKRVCEELPEESRLKEALEGLRGESNYITNADQTNAVSVEIPDNVFGTKDIEEFGITLDSDIYAYADVFGIPHSRVYTDDSTSSFFFYNIEEPFIKAFGSLVVEQSLSRHGTALDRLGYVWFNQGMVNVAWETPDHVPALESAPIRGIKIGTPVEDVVRSFYMSEEAAILFERNGINGFAENLLSSNGWDVYVLYQFSDQSKTSVGYWQQPPDSYPYLAYELDRDTELSYSVKFIIHNGVVYSIYWTISDGGGIPSFLNPYTD